MTLLLDNVNDAGGAIACDVRTSAWDRKMSCLIVVNRPSVAGTANRPSVAGTANGRQLLGLLILLLVC